jgi:manganese/zinc/iron transport system permease protein
MMILLSLSIVISIQAVGVILVCAMLIIPSATAYLFCERLRRMIQVASVLGMASGLLGAYFSYLGSNLPTGPFMVVSAGFVFGAGYLLAPRHGVLVRWWRQRLTRTRTEMENTLKAAYQVLERAKFLDEDIPMDALAERRQEPMSVIRGKIADLARRGFAIASDNGFRLTREGFIRACEVVRNHRLWELYLVQEADIAADHVHDDAEIIEHILGPQVVMRLERKLKFPQFDPHGKPIPSLRDLERASFMEDAPVISRHEEILERFRESGGQL